MNRHRHIRYSRTGYEHRVPRHRMTGWDLAVRIASLVVSLAILLVLITGWVGHARWH